MPQISRPFVHGIILIAKNRILDESGKHLNHANLYRRSSLKFRALAAKTMSPRNERRERSKIHP